MLVGVSSVGRAKAAKRWRELEGRLQVTIAVSGMINVWDSALNTPSCTLGPHPRSLAAERMALDA